MTKRWKIPSAQLPFGGFAMPLTIAILYGLLAASTIYLTSALNSVSVLWPANALPLALTMLRPRREWPAIIGAAFVGSVASTFIVRGLLLAPALFAVSNAAEILLAAWLIDVSRGEVSAESGKGMLSDLRKMVKFTIGAAIIAPAASALLGAVTSEYLFGQEFRHAYLVWFCSDSLGILIFTPFFYALFAGQCRRVWREASPARRWEAIGLLGLTALVALLVFIADRPLVFLVVMPTMLVAFRLGWLGVKVAVVLVAVIGTVATMHGLGPIVMLSEDSQIRAHFLQIFLAAQLLTQWPLVLTLEARDALMQELAKSERSLRILSARSCVLMLTFDVGGTCRKAIGALDLLPGHSVDGMPDLAIEELVEGSAALLRHAHEIALDLPDISHSVEFRIWSRDERWLEATFRALEDEGGRCPGTLMTLQDISERKIQTMALALSAQTDSLTGLLNRAGLMERLEGALSGAGTGSLVLAMIDVDRFKLINDNCGHQSGDLVLQAVAHRLVAELRASDAVGRMGGDEFVVLLEDMEWSRAQDICRRLVHAVGHSPILLASGQSISVAISCGVARHRPGMSADHFLHDADVALYEAKRGGRNRVVAA
ncbi:MAG: diguanylate cyclase [Sphingobium sp.]